MTKQQKSYLLFAICLDIVIIPIIIFHPTLARSNDLQQNVAFLESPFYGLISISSVFDHNQAEGQILTLNGLTADSANCPCPTAPDDGCVHPQWTSVYYSCDIPGYMSYDNHAGIDYLLRYDEVRAAAPGNVIEAGWANNNHERSYGLHVRIDHDIDGDDVSDYRTIYGHMSVLRVHDGDEITADDDEFARIIGVSGDTGDSTGPHLHFEVRTANQTQVDPYGPNSDANQKLWIENPAIVSHFAYTSGDHPLIAPSIAEDNRGHFTIDDGDADFVEETAGCWTTNDASGWDGDYLSRNVPNAATCVAAWNFPETQRAGFYHVFVHVPNDNVAAGDRAATADTASYTITHALSDAQPWAKQEEIVIVNQWVYPNGNHPSPWAYAGTYYFNSSQGIDSIKLNTALADSRDGTLAADAVRFSPVIYHLYLPLVLKGWPPLPGTPVLNAVNPDHLPDYDVTWNSADLADNYTLQEAGSPTFDDAVTRYSGPATAWPATGKTPGYYYYRVRASNIWGNGSWSNLQQAYVAFPTPTPTLTPVPSPTATPDPCGQDNRLVNADFENESPAPWEQFSSGGFNIISQGDAYSGTHRAFFGGFNNAQESLRQSFAVPAGVDWGGLSYWHVISTTEPTNTPFDTLQIGLQNTPGNYLAETITLSNQDAEAGWHKDIILVHGLAPWAGQTLWLSLEATTDGSNPTVFLADTCTLILYCDDAMARAMIDADDIPVIHLPPPTPTPTPP